MDQEDESASIIRYTTAAGALLGLVAGDLSRANEPGEITSQSVIAMVASAAMIRIWIRVRHGKMPVVESFVPTLIRFWAEDQGYRQKSDLAPGTRDWLSSRKMIQHPPIIGKTLAAALRADRFGDEPVNESWGAGGLPLAVAMGVTPVSPGFGGDIEELTAKVVSRTHGHEIAQLAGSSLALILNSLGESPDLPDAVNRASVKIAAPDSEILKGFSPDHRSAVTTMLSSAVSRSDGGGAWRKASEFGWAGHRADEALGLAIWAALSADSVSEAAHLASFGMPEKHATAAIAGAIRGAVRGSEIGRTWDYLDASRRPPDLAAMVLGEDHDIPEHMVVTVETVAADLIRIYRNPRPTELDNFRWPGY